MSGETSRCNGWKLTVPLVSAIVTMIGTAPVWADFNHDGRAHLAIASKYTTVNSIVRAGLVMEVDGGSGGITIEDRLWHQVADLFEVRVANDRFGWPLVIAPTSDAGSGDAIFSDGFETGTTSAWSSVTP